MTYDRAYEQATPPSPRNGTCWFPAESYSKRKILRGEETEQENADAGGRVDQTREVA